MFQRLGCAITVFLFLVPFLSCVNHDKGQKHEFRQIPELRQIKPEKPVKIKLRRNASGSYSWELRGDEAGKVIEADRKLRESLNKEENE